MYQDSAVEHNSLLWKMVVGHSQMNFESDYTQRTEDPFCKITTVTLQRKNSNENNFQHKNQRTIAATTLQFFHPFKHSLRYESHEGEPTEKEMMLN